MYYMVYAVSACRDCSLISEDAMVFRNPFLPKDREEYLLAEKLRRLRAQRGLTQKEVAQIAGIDESTVRNYELARRVPDPEQVRGLATALEVMPEALALFNDHASHTELFLMTIEIARHYGFEFGYNDSFAYITPTREFFIEGIGRWAKTYEAMCKDEESFREDYELWKDEFHGHFKKADYPAVYPYYDPMKLDSEKEWVSGHFAAALKGARRLSGMTQEELSEKAGISMFTLRSYEQGKRLPREKQMKAICEALGITECALNRHYFGSPNQAMHHLFSLASAANLTPENDAEAGPRLRTRGNMVEFAFVCMTDEVEKLEDDPSAAKQDEFTNWLNTFSCEDDDAILTARKAGRLWGNDRNLPPKV